MYDEFNLKQSLVSMIYITTIQRFKDLWGP